jgi:hypothetical protein
MVPKLWCKDGGGRMSEGLQAILNDDGVFEEYDDTYDFTIHCESEEEQEEVLNKLNWRWIPVSEKLPEINQRVLVTSYGRVCYAMMTSVDGNSGYPIFRLQDSLNERVICETTVHSEFTTSRITAWMPLPQPYKGESEDKDADGD